MAVKKNAEVMIVNRRSKKALQATGLDNGLVVEQAAPTGSDAQLWTAVEADGALKLVNKASGKVLDVMEEGTDNGTRAQTWEDVNGATQKWQLVKVTATYSKLVNVNAGKVLDIADMSDEDGAPAQLWEDVDGDGQQWKLVAAGEKAEEKKAAPAKKAPAKKAPAKKAVEKKVEAPKAEVKKAVEKKVEAPKAEVKKAVEKKVEAVKAEIKKAAPKAKK